MTNSKRIMKSVKHLSATITGVRFNQLWQNGPGYQ